MSALHSDIHGATMMRKRVIDEPKNLIHNVVPKRADIGRCTPDNGHFLDVSRQIYQMPTKTSRSAFLAKPSHAYGRRAASVAFQVLKRILRRKLENPGIEGALDYTKGS